MFNLYTIPNSVDISEKETIEERVLTLINLKNSNQKLYMHDA